MKTLKTLAYAFLIASIGYSARELFAVAKAAREMTSGAAGPAKTAAPPDPVKAITDALERAERTGELPADGAAAPAAPALPRPAPPRPSHVEVYNAASTGGKLIAGKGVHGRPVAPGGGVLVDAQGNRLEVLPSPKPPPTAAQRSGGLAEAVGKAGSAVAEALPSLDDPTADLQARKRRAELILVLSALGAFALAAWARRWRAQ